MPDSSKQVKVAARDLMTAIDAWLSDVGAEVRYLLAYFGFIIGRNYAAVTRMKHAQMVKRFPKPQRPSAKALAPAPLPGEPTQTQTKPAPQPAEKSTSQSKPTPMKEEQSTTKTAAKPQQPAAMKPESSTSKVSATKEPAPIPKAAPKKPPVVKTAQAVVPPNVERAVSAQLKASGKDRMSFDEMMSLMTALGVGPAEAKGALQLLKSQTQREHVITDDLTLLQGWITKGWIITKRRQYRHFEIAVREQFGLELNAPLVQDEIVAELIKRGFSPTAASDVATKLITRDWLTA